MTSAVVVDEEYNIKIVSSTAIKLKRMLSIFLFAFLPNFCTCISGRNMFGYKLTELELKILIIPKSPVRQRQSADAENVPRKKNIVNG